VPPRPALVPTTADLLVGLPLGWVEAGARWPSPGDAPPWPESPAAALDAILRPHLARPPCLVAFSGGRDSSALLAWATRLARLERLEAPIAATLRFDFAATREDEWQELVVAHVGPGDWLQVNVVEDELDLVGPIAAAGLGRHGVLFPPNGHLVRALTPLARGGSLLVGTGGDEVLGGWAWSALADALAGRSPSWRGVAAALAPARLRREMVRRRSGWTLPWLREPARSRVATAYAAFAAEAPRGWSARMAWLAGSRVWNAAAWSGALLGGDDGVVVAAPFLDARWLRALALAGGRLGWGDRTATMAAVFGSVLPDEVLGRAGKASFGRVFLGGHTRRFLEGWDGVRGVDAHAVDGEALRRAALSGEGHFAAGMLLQSAWLESGP